jgi:Zn-finger protein
MHKVKLVCQYIFCLFVFALQLQCNNAKDVNGENLIDNIAKSHKITSENINQIKYTEYVLSDLADVETKDWQKFQNLLDQIEILKKGDVAFVKDDKAILQSFITDLKNEIPESLNATSITVRLTVLETTLFKLNEILNLQNVTKQSILSNIKEVLIAYNNLVLQINKKVEKESQKIVKP